LLVTAAFVALLYRHAPLAGVLLGLAIWSKWTNIVFLPLPGLFLLQRRDLRSFIGYGIAAALPIAGLLLLNQHMFGSPFITPYDHVLIREHGKFVIQPSHRTFFNMPFWDGLWTQLTDKQLGLFEACPPILLAPLGAFLLARRAPAEALLLFGACAAQLATFAKYEQWQAASYGPRFLLSVVTLGALLVAPVLDRLFVGRRSD
jgi:hypothetical protein